MTLVDEGEICISGLSVGPGYYKMDELNKERFVENPFNVSNDEAFNVLFKTGDLGRRLESGAIAYLSRKDRCIKLRGQRVELEEVESLINSVKKIDACHVMTVGEYEHKMLIAFILSQENEASLRVILKDKFSHELLPYMMPQKLIFIEEMPLTVSGKVDARKLLEVYNARFN